MIDRLSIFVILSLSSSLALSGLDRDGSGVSDVYEWQMGHTLQASEDFDGDGYDNRLESLMGTNALDPNSPGWIFRKNDGGLEFKIAAQPGVPFRMESGTALDTFSVHAFLPANQPNAIGYSPDPIIPLVEGETRFFRLVYLTPTASDGDELDDYEEYILGTDINLPDTDSDGFYDSEEFLHSTSATNDLDTPALATAQAWSNAYQIKGGGNIGTAGDRAWSNAYQVTGGGNIGIVEQQAWSNAYIVRNDANRGTFLKQSWSNAYIVQNDAVVD